jgi:aryl-alcohol dehydrogenase-like predicted oxidoreductase
MEARRVGSLDVTVVGLGCNNFGRRVDDEGSRAVIDAALEDGVTFFDTSDNYGDGHSEEIIGRALEGGRRDEVVLATKFGGWNPDLNREGGAGAPYIRERVETSLRKLRTDRIDLYQLHTPDASTPIAETLGALDELVKQGKVREIGCSNFDAAMLREADDAARERGTVRFASVQNELSLIERTDDALAEAERLGVAYIPYFPLASGLLTGKFRRDADLPEGSRIARFWSQDQRDETLTEETWDRIEKLTAFAEERGHTLLELAFAWLLSQTPVASVIAGATKPEQVRANAAAAAWRLTPDEVAALR